MKKKLFATLAFFSGVIGKADNISLTIIDGIDNPAVKAKIEYNTSLILNEINAAQAGARSLDFHKMNVKRDLVKDMEWELERKGED